MRAIYDERSHFTGAQNMQMKGLYTALITPFDSSGKLDELGLRNNLRFQLKHRVDGIVLLGTTGETPTLTAKEKERIIRIGVEEVKGNSQLIIGTGSNSTDQTIESTLKAKELGADCALVVIPYYNKPTSEGLYLHFKALSESTDIPVCVYNIPGRTGINLSVDTLKRIAKLPNIIGIKEASGNMIQMAEIIEQLIPHHPKFTILSGDDALTLPLLAVGGHGIISVASNLVPGPMKELVHAGLSGDFIKARQLHNHLAPLFRGLFIETNPMPIKAMMQICGMAAGPCRLPLCELQEDSKMKLSQLIQQFSHQWLS